jgi:hypothetical protein
LEDSVVGRAVGVAFVIAAAGVLLTGCVVAPPDPTQPPTSTPMPSQSATPAPPTTAPVAAEPAPVDTVVAHITVRPEHLDLVNGAGIVVGELSYDADAGTFVDTISTVLGGPPDVEERPGGHEWHAWTSYTWPGVVVNDDHEPSGYSSDMNVMVQFTHPVVGNGISVSTTQGFRPGDDLRALADQLGEEWHGTGYDEFPVETGPDLGERMYDSWTDTYWKYANANAVAATQWNWNDPSVTSVISAPWNFGIGHV